MKWKLLLSTAKKVVWGLRVSDWEWEWQWEWVGVSVCELS